MMGLTWQAMAAKLTVAANALRSLEKQQEAMPVFRKAIAATEEVIRIGPQPERFWASVRFYGAFQKASDNAGDLNDWESAIQLRTEWQKLALEHPRQEGPFWRTLADDQLKISSAQDLAGHPEASAQARRQAVEYFLKMRGVANGFVSTSQGKNLAALENFAQANQFLSFISERASDSKAATEYAKALLEAAQKLVAADSKRQEYRSLLADAKGMMVRLQSLADPKAAMAPLDLASGWRAYANACTAETFYPCLEEAAKAVDMGRKAAAANASAESRNDLAMDLSQLASSAAVAARNSRGAARRAALEQSIAANRECHEMVAALERDGVKPDTTSINPALVVVSIENAREKLAEMDRTADTALK